MNKTWNANVIGVLASDESVQRALGKKAVFKTAEGLIQFYVRIISRAPDSFPHRFVALFSTDLEKWGFDREDVLENEARKVVQFFLEENLLVFQPQRKRLENGSEEIVGKNVCLIPKSEFYHEGEHVTPLPVFSEEEHGISELEFVSKLKAEQPVGKIGHFSTEKNDTPRYILWKNTNSDLKLYGEFTSHLYGEDGFQYKSDKRIKSSTFDDEWLDNCYEQGSTLFVPHDIFSKIEGMMLAAEPLLMSLPQSRPVVEDQRQSPTVVETFSNGTFEEDFMEAFARTTQVEGLLYDKKDLYNFHTAMKSSNLVILAGMSGTGKSQLVKAYGKALGIDETDQLTFVAVRPAWTDDADVIGYADTLNHIYRPGDSGVVDTLLRAKENPTMLHIICFDEMNLARVEHYFSQFLSVLEMESEQSRVLRLYNDNLEGKLTNAEMYPPVVPIGDNVIFVGTVNLDESTFHFSDKVLDRANVITLNVQPFSSLKSITTESFEKKVYEKVDYDLFNISQNKGREIELTENELAFLWDMHLQLQKVNKNLGVGPRIVRQIDLYLKNLPTSANYTREDAIDKQIVQRILTKVRGPEVQLKDLIGIYDSQTEKMEESILIDILDRYRDVSKFTETRHVLIQKAKELKVNGYTL